MSGASQTMVRCHGCVHFFITHEPQHPYGCHHFGFKSRKLPAQTVVESSGIQCAYRIARGSARNNGIGTRGKSDVR